MGNIVAGEALRQAGANQVVNTYAAMQGAVASHAYDPSRPTRSLGIADNNTPNRYAQYYTNGAPCYFNSSAGAGTYVNFFNTNDWALAALQWQLDQNIKPDVGYGYDGTNFYYAPFLTTTYLYFPTATYTIFAYCDEARCYALGAQSGVGGVFHGNQIELDSAPYLFGTAHKYHSGEFRSDNAQRWQFWNEFLFQMGLK
jgi:lysozyme family protein